MPGDNTISGDHSGKQSESYLQQAIDWSWHHTVGAATHEQQTPAAVVELGSQLVKTAALFVPGKLGVAASVAFGAADQAKPGDGAGAQAVDALLGAGKGSAMRGVMALPVKGDLVTRAITLGVSNRLVDGVLDRQTYFDPQTHKFNLVGGLGRAVATAGNPYSLATDVATFGLAEGALRLGNSWTNNLLTRRPLYANAFTGGVFGFSTGAAGEAQREWSEHKSLNPLSILGHGTLSGLVGAAAAAPGGMMREHALKNPDFIVVGGGIHGVQQALQISEVLGSRSVTVVDPHQDLLGRWKHVTGNTEMTHLRSPMGHFLGTQSLPDYCWINDRTSEIAVSPTDMSAQRPGLKLFNDHADSQIRKTGINERHLQTSADALKFTKDGVEVSTDIGRIRGKYVVLAMGPGEGNLPQFAKAARANGGTVNHIFDENFNINDVQKGERVAIIGGGITAGQAAVAVAKRGAEPTLITREPLKASALDFPKEWATAEGVAQLEGVPFDQRRAIIDSNRFKGTVPPWVMKDLMAISDKGQLQREVSPVHAAFGHPDGTVTLFAESGAKTFDRVILATGFEGGRPGGALVNNAVRDYGLPTAADGFPVVNRSLQWGNDRLFVSGPLAELEIGPASRNVVGSQLAADRIRPFLYGVRLQNQIAEESMSPRNLINKLLGRRRTQPSSPSAKSEFYF